jgi:hypothetical protein
MMLLKIKITFAHHQYSHCHLPLPPPSVEHKQDTVDAKQKAATLTCVVVHISLSTMSKPMAKFFGKFTDDGSKTCCTCPSIKCFVERVFSQVKLICETCGVSPLEETL